MSTDFRANVLKVSSACHNTTTPNRMSECTITKTIYFFVHVSAPKRKCMVHRIRIGVYVMSVSLIIFKMCDFKFRMQVF